MNQMTLFEAPTPEAALHDSYVTRWNQQCDLALARLERVLEWRPDEFDIGFAHWAVILEAVGPFEVVDSVTRRGDLNFHALAWAVGRLVQDGKLEEIRHYFGAEQPARKKGEPEYLGFRSSYRVIEQRCG